MSRNPITLVEIWDQTEPPWDARGVPWIVRILVRWGITITAFLAAEWFVNRVFAGDPFYLDGWQAIVFAPAIFVAIRAVLRPILMFLTCPLQLITLGLFMLVVNALVLIAAEEVSDWFSLDFAIDGFLEALVGALAISLVSFVISRVLRRNPFGTLA